MLDRSGHVFVYQEAQARKARRSAACRPIHADLSGTYLWREHADRRLLVLPLHGCLRSGNHTLRCRQDLWSVDLWSRLVWLCLLDFLPYTVPKQPRKNIGWIRYVTFALSLIFVAALFLAHVGNIEKIMFWAFIVGNIIYYAVGIILAYAFKDNRAFCKYICPITVFLKPMSYYALIRVKCDKEKCISCGKCKRVCPMDVDVTDNSRKRANGTECILCMECVKT